MSEENFDIIKKLPSGSPSPATIEKSDSSSSRQSESPLQWDIDPFIISDHINCETRIRPSSWDDSDDDSSLNSERNIKSSRLYSSNSGQFRGSVAAEINEIKRQFFETLENSKQENDDGDLESLKEKMEMRLNSDRRQSPARMRRRTKSSSSSSPVLESKRYNSPEKFSPPEAVLDEVSPKVLELDPKLYLNNFFTELRSKRISLVDSTPNSTTIIPPAGDLSDSEECIPICKEIKSPKPNENDEYFCLTTRKLSQILEVEENKTDLEKSSEEKVENSEFFFKTLKSSKENNFSPLQTARSKKSVENFEKIGQQEQKFRSLSDEEFGNFRKVSKPFQGSLSERTAKIFDYKINDFISLSSNSQKALPNTPRTGHNNNAERQFSSVSPARSEENNTDLPVATIPNYIENNFEPQECLKIELMKTFTSENSTPRKSIERSESHTNKSLSAKSRTSSNLESPKFTINLGKDSARSLKIEDLNTPDSSKNHQKNETPSELKTPSLENAYKSPTTSERSSESKTERNLQISRRSHESVKSASQRSKELEENYLKSHRSTYRTQESSRKKESERYNNQTVESEATEQELTFMPGKPGSYSSVESSRSYGNPFNISSRSESSTKCLHMERSKIDEQEPQKVSKTPSSKSSKSLKSDKSRTSKSDDDRLNDELLNQETPRSNKIPELSLPLGISKRPESQKGSYWSEKIDLDDATKGSDRSESNVFKNPSQKASERSLSSRSKNLGPKSTPHSLKSSSKTSSSRSSRSKGSLENRDDIENVDGIRIAAWKELEKVYDTISNHSSTSFDSGKNSWKESDMPNKQVSDTKDLSDYVITPKINESSEKKLPRSRKSSRRSVDSRVSEESENNSLQTSSYKKSRPSSWAPEEHKTTDNPEIEKLDNVSLDEETSGEIFTFEEDENSEGNHPLQKSESGIESDRQSNKRLSIINEASFEDIEVSTEKEEKDVWIQSRPHSRRGSRQVSPQRITKTPKVTPKSSSRSLNENPLNESISQLSNPNDGKWNELIEKFYESSDTQFTLTGTFPSFLSEKENLYNSPKNYSIDENAMDNESHDSKEDFNTLAMTIKNKYEPSKNNTSLEKTIGGKDEGYLVHEESLLKTTLKEKDLRPAQNSQNMYYLSLDKEAPLEIGEFGDIKSWNVCQSDTTASEKPRDHGDGTQIQKASEVLLVSEKREKEVKTQRQLWTELREDFRHSKPFLNNQFREIDIDINVKRSTLSGLNISKSDNCIEKKNSVRSDSESDLACEFLSENSRLPKNTENKFLELENCTKRENCIKSILKDSTEHFSAESLVPEKYSENEEFEGEITPRLCRSLSNLESQFKKGSIMSGRSEESLKTSEIQCFKPNCCGEEKEFTDVNIFLAHNEKEKMAAKSKNWLNIENPERKKSRKQDQKTKKKKKISPPSKDSFQEYLSSKRIRPNVPHLKLRNSNCFQNFYKRVISVFCLTSQSSAATSE